MNVYIIRHTSVAVPQGVCYGQTDVELTQSFEEEATEVKKKMGTLNIDSAFASPLTRCKRLAHFCIDNQQIHFDSRIKEMNFGSWEMKKWTDLDTTAWEKDWINHVVPEGESFALLYNRVKSFLDDLIKQNHDNIAIFTHGGVCACAYVYFGAIQPEEAWDLQISFGQINKFTV